VASPAGSADDGSLAAATERLGRLLASPTGVLIIVPALVILAGVSVMVLGRRATSYASESMARAQLASQAADVQHDIAFALDQAEPVLKRMGALADPAAPIADVAVRLHDLQLGRPGVTNLSLGFPDGVMRGTYTSGAEIGVQESRIASDGTHRTNYQITGSTSRAIGETRTDYDVRTRPHYVAAVAAHRRTWTPPRTFFTTHTTGMTCAEPLYAADGNLVAVTTVDFDVGALSEFIVRAPLAGSRTIMFAGDGTILAFPGVAVPAAAKQENRLLVHGDYADGALEALFVAMGSARPTEQAFYTVHADDGDYLASVAPIGGLRAAIDAPLDWYLATLVPEDTLLGPTHRLAKQTFIASAAALAIAMGVALVFAWNLVRMRRAVGVARARAQSAEARVKELGSYRLVSRIGTGGMGEVWRAEHRLLARQAAIKLVRPEVLADPAHAAKARERFRREAQTLASMRSRHTIELYDYGVTDDGTFFFVMEMLDGLDLDRLVRTHGPQPAARVIRILIQACQSLAEAHEAGLLHRDIKPANLFISRAADEVDVVKLLDFGIVRVVADEQDEVATAPMRGPAEPTVPLEPIIPETASARSRERLTQLGAVVGTPGYIPPELAAGKTTDARADLYALGCVAWWLLTASEVYRRTDEATVIQLHQTAPIPSLRDRMKGWLPNELAALVVSCLAKDRQDRPHDARTLADALRAIPIPADHAWSDAQAASWWSHYRPPSTAADATDETAVERLVIPAPSEPAESATAPARPSRR